MNGVLLWIAVAVTGGVGATLRWLIDTRIISALNRRGLPIGTLAVNLTGAAALGLISGVALSGDALILLGTALVGSYSTFSTWMLETQRLGERRRGAPAAANIVISLLVGLGAAAFGRLIGGEL